MGLVAIQGAVQVGANTRALILEATGELVAELLARNDLSVDDLVSMLFTVTPDLDAEFPAVAARMGGCRHVPLMCAVEVAVPGPPRVVRLLAHAESGRPRSRVEHVYLGDAAVLRPAPAGRGPAGPRPGTGPALRRIAVIGTGLIGTSIALAMRERGVEVLVRDRDSAAARLAVQRGAGVPLSGPPDEPADVAVLAVPPAAVAPALLAAQKDGVARAYTDVAGVKGAPLNEAAELGCDLSAFVGGHPLRGRERSGPLAARADLFVGSAWALCPTGESGPAAVASVTELVLGCGATPVTMDAAGHDHAMALVSHAPHVVSSAMAARFADAPRRLLDLAGRGADDVTRIAAGDPRLWLEILAANAAPIADVLDAVARDLARTAAALRERPGAADARHEVADLLVRGATGRGRMPKRDRAISPNPRPTSAR